jgi:hypothetical protein
MGGEAITIGSLAAIADHHKKEKNLQDPNTLKHRGDGVCKAIFVNATIFLQHQF